MDIRWTILGLLLLVVLVLIVLHVRRRRARSASMSDASSDIAPVLPFSNDDLMATDELFLDAELTARGTESASQFTRDELFSVGPPQTVPHLSERQRIAARQMEGVRSGERESWRQSERGHFIRLEDGRESLILERPVLRRSAEAALQELIDREGNVHRGLGTSAPLIDLQWPQEVRLEYDGGILGYLGPGLDQSFVISSRRHGSMVRTLRCAIDPEVDEEIDLQGRLKLARLVATWLKSLHAANVVHGNVGLNSIAFEPASSRIAPLDYATSRVLGHGAWLSAPGSSSGATVELTEATMDDDRRAFARLVFALISGESSDLNALLAQDMNVPGASLEMARLRWLLIRSTGPSGSMPTLDEWVVALGDLLDV